MDVFDLRNRLDDDYENGMHSFMKIVDECINGMVEQALDGGALWSESRLQMNPTFQPRRPLAS